MEQFCGTLCTIALHASLPQQKTEHVSCVISSCVLSFIKGYLFLSESAFLERRLDQVKVNNVGVVCECEKALGCRYLVFFFFFITNIITYLGGFPPLIKIACVMYKPMSDFEVFLFLFFNPPPP